MHSSWDSTRIQAIIGCLSGSVYSSENPKHLRVRQISISIHEGYCRGEACPVKGIDHARQLAAQCKPGLATALAEEAAVADVREAVRRDRQQGMNPSRAETARGVRDSSPHPDRARHIEPWDRWANCVKGLVYEQNEWALRIRVAGQAPLVATIYGRERLRCSLCGEVLEPEGGARKNGETTRTIGLRRYGSGFPRYRLDADLGIPLPTATQGILVSARRVVWCCALNADSSKQWKTHPHRGPPSGRMPRPKPSSPGQTLRPGEEPPQIRPIFLFVISGFFYRTAWGESSYLFPRMWGS